MAKTAASVIKRTFLPAHCLNGNRNLQAQYEGRSTRCDKAAAPVDVVVVGRVRDKG